MATIDAPSSTALAGLIATVSSGDTINLTKTTASYASITTLAKRPSRSGVVSAFGYTITGNGKTITDTRIYQENVDGAVGAPGALSNVTLNYTSTTGVAAAGGALLSVSNLSATQRVFDLQSVSFTGQHSGWNGNGNKYISFTAFYSNTVNVKFDLTSSIVDITGQNNGFQTTFGVGSGGSAFFHNWNNTGAITITNTQFDEKGFLSSFNLFNTSTVHGSASITGNTFKRTANANVRWEGNRLQNVNATLSGNTFSDGSYLDLYGNVGSVTLTNNTFATIYGGSGIRFNDPNAPLTGTPSISSNSFTGYGLAISYVKTDSSNNPVVNSVYTVNGTNSVTAGTLSAKSFTRFTAGGAAGNTISLTDGDNWVNGGGGADTITTNGGSDYIIGGAGADTITTGGGSDTILYYATNEGADSITDFTPGTDKLAFRQGGGGTNAFASTITFQTGASPTTASATWTYNGGALLYWANGNGGGSTAIATFTGSPGITASDLVTF